MVQLFQIPSCHLGGNSTFLAVTVGLPTGATPLGRPATKTSSERQTRASTSPASTTKIPRKDPQERHKKRENCDRKEKKHEILGLPPFGPHFSGFPLTLRCRTFRAPMSYPRSSSQNSNKKRIAVTNAL